MRIGFIIISLILLGSCSQYQQVLKKGSPEEKYKAAVKYYHKKDYVRAQPLFEELLGLYFGKKEREEIYYYYAYTHYGLREYYLAGYHFQNFIKTYPLSDKREEVSYMYALCEYHKSMPRELDQTNTFAAIKALQSFINQFPNSSYIEDSNKKMDELRLRILNKVYENARLYYKTGEYKSAVVACNNALNDYPDMIHRDELHYIIIHSSFIYAENSIMSTQVERYEKTIKAIQEYLKEYNASNPYYKEVIKIMKKSEESIQQFQAKK